MEAKLPRFPVPQLSHRDAWHLCEWLGGREPPGRGCAQPSRTSPNKGQLVAHPRSPGKGSGGRPRCTPLFLEFGLVKLLSLARSKH